MEVTLFIGALVYGHPLPSEDNGIVGFDDFGRRAGDLDSATVEVGKEDTVEPKEGFRECDSDVCD